MTTVTPDRNHPRREALDASPVDPTQGRTFGADPYDDPTQGRQSPTQGLKIGSDPGDDPTRGRKTRAR